jgi:hypothetical protein
MLSAWFCQSSRILPEKSADPGRRKGSAPGHNTFDPFFERKEQEQQDEKGTKIIIFHGFQKLH